MRPSAPTLTSIFVTRPAWAGQVSLRRFGCLAVLFGVGQLLTWAAVCVMCVAKERSLSSIYLSWDAQHYLAIAEQGYRFDPSEDNPASPAFFPGYPLAVRCLSLGGLVPLRVSAAAVAIASCVGFVAGMMALASRLGVMVDVTRRWVLLLGSGPMSAVLVMPYTESLFCMLAVWSLVAVMDRQLIRAGLLGLLCGLVRPTAVAVALAVAVAAFDQVWRARAHAGLNRRLATSAGLAVSLAMAGCLAYWTWVGWRASSPGWWFSAQSRGWNSRFDFGKATAGWMLAALTDRPGLLDVVTTFAIIAAIVLTGRIATRLPLPLIAYTATIVAVVVGSDGIMNSKIRLLVPAFPLLLPLAQGMRRLPKVAVATTAMASAAYTGYALVVYPYAI